MNAARRLALAALLAILCAGCGSREPPPPEAVAAPVDALRLGMQSYRDHQFIAAQQLFAKAHALYRSVDDGRGQAIALMNLADTALVLGEHAQAERHLVEAERLVLRDGLRPFGAHLKLLQAQTHLAAGRHAEARAALDALLALPDAERALRDAANFERARLALDAGEDPRPWLERARAAYGRDAAATLRARLLRLDAELARRAGDAARSRALLDEALELYKIDLYRPGIAAAHEALGALALESGELPGARDHYERALAIRLWLNDRVHGANVLEALARVEDAGADAARATRLRELLAYLRGATQLEWRVVQQKYEQLGK